MPSRSITDGFVRNLNWTGALKAFWKEHEARNAKRKAAGNPEKEIQAPISITFIDKLERGLSLELLIG